MNLSGKTVLITGGRRVGAHLALALAQRGANVAMSYFKSRDAIESTAAEVRKLGVRAATIAADLRLPADAERLVAQTVAELVSIDALVNMASEFHPTPFDKLQSADFDDAIASNLKGPYLVAVAAARAMRKQPIVNGLQGKIINFTDWAVDRPYRNFLPYFISKGGVVAMTKALAAELAPTIAVNAIAPAMIDPPPNLSADDIEAIRQASPLKRLGAPSDAVHLV
ncbi:MAG: SDR family NAD(P)-dependent oxidoreductase, partial [Planctomycetia bacterium]|nr:SDR family NAD(P)-dependent oxidoreductase [Planctomycetia bacterium]